MSRIAQNYRNSRALMAIVFLLASLLFAWWWNPGPEQSRQMVQATVLPQQVDNNSDGLAVLLVELEQGETVRLYADGRRYSAGTVLTLVETTFESGERRYRIAPPERSWLDE